MNKYTKLTLDEMIRRKEQVLAAKKKPKTAELYIESLDGTITITEPDRALAVDAASMNDGTNDGDAYLVYQVVSEPPLKKLAPEFGCSEPTEIVDIVFKPGEITAIAQQALGLAGYGDNAVRAIAKEIKN